MLRKTVVCDTGQQIKTIFKQLSIVLLHYQYNLKTKDAIYKKVDIQPTALEAFLEQPLSGTLNI
jgi:hypothetical protein